MRVQRVMGLVLVFTGAALIGVFQMGLPAAIAPALVGAALLGVFAWTRSYGFLVPGGVLTGLGIGLLVETMRGTEGAIPIGLGAGFVFVTVLDHLAAGGRAGRWWPLLPGGILSAVGLAQYGEARGVMTPVASWWPLLLILAGVWLLMQRRRARRRGPALDRGGR